MDVIFGIHSIIEAINNPLRVEKKLYFTREALAELQKKGSLEKDWRNEVELIQKSPHSLQEEAKNLCRKEDFQFQRVPSQIFLTAEPLPEKDLGYLYQMIENPKCRLLILDGVTDVHNLAAVFRTAAFYNVSAIVVSRKGGVRLSPGFFRIASGATEYISLINTTALPRAIKQLRERGVRLLGLSEHASGPFPKDLSEGALGLVLGAEETGLSHAVRRTLVDCYALETQGSIKSLNVSVAAAVAMEKFFGI